MTITCNSYQKYNECVYVPVPVQSTRVMALTVSKTGSRSLVDLLTRIGILSHECHILPMKNCPKFLTDTWKPVNIPHIPIISVVRNPISRLVSEFAYRNKVTFVNSSYKTSLHAFFKQSYRYNWQVGVLSGMRWSAQVVPNAQVITMSHLKNIETRAYKKQLTLGIFENLEDSIRCILEKILFIPPKNIQNLKLDKRVTPLISFQDMTHLEKEYGTYHTLDSELHNTAKKIVCSTCSGINLLKCT